MNMNIKYMIDGSNVYIFKMNAETALDKLPAKIYTIKQNPVTGFYLEITKDKLKVPSKIYGASNIRVRKCLKTYKERSTSTGILLTGDKGTGKTLLMSLLANEVIDRLDVPVILIKEAFSGTQFVSFIETIGECCLIFDEFGKMYTSLNTHDEDSGAISQQSLLSLMDGVDKTKRLIIMTENNEYDINEFILNRPSRVYYHFRYHKLDEKSIKDYCNDFNVDKRITIDIINLSRRSRIFSFDMLQSIIEEHLRFDSTVDEIIHDLNIDIREGISAKLKILKVIDNTTKKERHIIESPFITKPDRYDYSYIKLKPSHSDTKSPSDKCRAVGGNISTNVEVPTEEENYDEFSIKESDLVFESKTKLIYETNKFTVITEEVPLTFTNYSLLV